MMPHHDAIAPTYLIFCMHASMSSVVSISAPDEAVRPKLQSYSDKLFGHWSDFCGQMDLQLASESKRGYTVSPSNRWIIVCMIAICQMSVNPYFQYNMLTRNLLFRRKNVGNTNQIAELV